jgi:Fe-S-cluster containining protein
VSEPPDCRTCGACCHGDELWIRLAAGDVERLGDERARRLTVLVESGRGFVARSMRMTAGRCTAYRDALPDGAGCGCSIYDARPAICRAFESGSADCLAARRRRGIDR